MITQQWAEHYYDMAGQVATWSKGRGRKVGAVIFNPMVPGSVLSVGYNCAPGRCYEGGAELPPIIQTPHYDFQKSFAAFDEKYRQVEARMEPPLKYEWGEHAERKAIYFAARHGIALQNMGMAIQWFPCNECARAIIDSGLALLVCTKPDPTEPRWGYKFQIALEMFEENKQVSILYLDPKKDK